MSRVLVCGGRTFNDAGAMRNWLELLTDKGDTVVEGAASGADRLAGTIAREFGLEVEEHPADWATHGRSAGFKRNVEMLDSGVDRVLAFWDGASRGTAHTINEAKLRGIPVQVVRYV